MANHRFKISNMIPTSWVFKLKDVSRSKKVKNKITAASSSLATLPEPTKSHNDDEPAADHRKSYYFTRDLNVPDSPRKSSKKRRPPAQKNPVHRKLEVNSAGRCHCRVTPESVWTESSYPGSNSSDTDFLSPVNCPCKANSWYDDVYLKVNLRPIITKPAKEAELGSGKWVMEGGGRSLSVRRFSGGKVKGNSYSPRIGNRVRVQGKNGGRRSMGKRRSLAESMAVVKTSVDPQRDFKESMVEMIMENNMKSSKDLEDLLACYLSLNSDEYHELIIKVFKQIWFESTNIRL